MRFEAIMTIICITAIKALKKKEKENMLKLILGQSSMEFEFHLVFIPHLDVMYFFNGVFKSHTS
jgi:hypothetical protein